MNIERRDFPVELRVEKREGIKTRIVGHAAVFNSLSIDLGGFREELAPGAFAESIKSDDVRGLFNHNPDHVLGRNTAGTLTLEEDKQGLLYELDPPDTQLARDLMVSIERRDISQNSFAFTVLPDGQKWREDENGTLIRVLTHLKLYDISIVTYPAYPETDVALRCSGEALAAEGRKILEAVKASKEPLFDPSQLDIRRRRLDLASL